MHKGKSLPMEHRHALMQLVRYMSLLTSSYSSCRGSGLAGVASRPSASSSDTTRRSTSGCVTIINLS